MTADLTADVPGPHGGRPVVTAGAPRGATEAVVLCLHGRGATAQGVVNLFEPVYRHGVTFLAPEAERSRWYPHAADTPIEHNEPHRSSALAVVDALVDHATSVFGVTREQVVLAGFSQGACVVAEYAADNPVRYGGVFVLSGTLLGPDIQPARYEGDLEGAPVFVGCGGADPRISKDRVRATAAVFRTLGGTVTERLYDDVGHEVTDEEFDRLSDLLATLLDH